jgi:hypothetical protein
MKISKLLLGTILVSLCMSGLAIGDSSIGLSDPMGPNGNTYAYGDTVTYILGVENTGDITLLDIDVYFFAPDNPPTGAICDDPAAVGGVYVGTVASLDPGETDGFEVDWPVTGVPCGGENLQSLLARVLFIMRKDQFFCDVTKKLPKTLSNLWIRLFAILAAQQLYAKEIAMSNTLQALLRILIVGLFLGTQLSMGLLMGHLC